MGMNKNKKTATLSISLAFVPWVILFSSNIVYQSTQNQLAYQLLEPSLHFLSFLAYSVIGIVGLVLGLSSIKKHTMLGLIGTILNTITVSIIFLGMAKP